MLVAISSSHLCSTSMRLLTYIDTGLSKSSHGIMSVVCSLQPSGPIHSTEISKHKNRKGSLPPKIILPAVHALGTLCSSTPFPGKEDKGLEGRQPARDHRVGEIPSRPVCLQGQCSFCCIASLA